MSSSLPLQLPASPLGYGLSGSWTLARDRAVTLDARQAGFLHIAHGAVWATFDGPQHGPANDLGDVVLTNGARIHLTAGRQVVLESFPTAANDDACFSWEPDADDSAQQGRGYGTALAPRLAALGRQIRRWVSVPVRWPTLAPGAFAESKARAAQQLRYLLTNQP